VYVHTCMKMHCYFLLNVKHGASQLYLREGGGSNYLAPALSRPLPLDSLAPSKQSSWLRPLCQQKYQSTTQCNVRRHCLTTVEWIVGTTVPSSVADTCSRM